MRSYIHHTVPRFQCSAFQIDLIKNIFTINKILFFSWGSEILNMEISKKKTTEKYQNNLKQQMQSKRIKLVATQRALEIPMAHVIYAKFNALCVHQTNEEWSSIEISFEQWKICKHKHLLPLNFQLDSNILVINHNRISGRFRFQAKWKSPTSVALELLKNF